MTLLQGFAVGMLFLFYLTFLGRTLVLTVQGHTVIVLGNGKKGFARFLELSLLLGLLVWSYEVANFSFLWNRSILPSFINRPIFEYAPLQWAGMAIILAGYLFFAAALFSFGTSWRVGVDKEDPGELVTSGVFSISRNPVFLFFDVYFLGMWLIIGSPFFLVSAFAVVGAMHYQILQEEKFLNEHYGESYTRYKNRVRRYI